jgi:ABC-type uncharacterized transport system auxiliary subunit
MITDFFVARYNKLNAFSQGVVKSSSVLLPQYIMEGQVLDMIARNSGSVAEGSNYVTLSIRINVIKLETKNASKQVILSKVYDTKIPRRDETVTTIPIAYSQAFSELADQALADIHIAISTDVKNNKPKDDSPPKSNY